LPRWKNSIQTDEALTRIKREAVIKGAGRAFSKRGYHNTSLDDVAKSLQVAKGTLYNYVKDKQEILFELHKVAMDLGEQAFAQGAQQGSTGAESLRSVIHKYVELLTVELGACSALIEVDALKPADRIQAVKKRDAFERGFIAIIKRGIADGSLREVDPQLAVFTFMGAINWLPRWFTPEGRLPAEEVASKMTDLLMGGLISTASAPAVAAPRRARVT
jgi:AcrR family transcriptional regulator